MPLFTELAREAKRRAGDFKQQDLANTAWAFATVGNADAPLFTALAREGQRRAGDFNPQNLANTAWAFATSKEPAPDLLHPLLVLDAIAACGTK